MVLQAETDNLKKGRFMKPLEKLIKKDENLNFAKHG
jgi:hypothetical protein